MSALVLASCFQSICLFVKYTFLHENSLALFLALFSPFFLPLILFSLYCAQCFTKQSPLHVTLLTGFAVLGIKLAECLYGQKNRFQLLCFKWQYTASSNPFWWVFSSIQSSITIATTQTASMASQYIFKGGHFHLKFKSIFTHALPLAPPLVGTLCQFWFQLFPICFSTNFIRSSYSLDTRTAS